MTAKLADQAANPNTPLDVLADLAYRHPKLRAAIAANPSTYPDLLEWLAYLGDPEVDAALRVRTGSLTDEERAADPITDPAELAELAYQHPELRPIISANPSAYEGLRDWIAQVSAPAFGSTAMRIVAPAETSPRPSRLARLNAKFGPTFTLDTLTLLVAITVAAVVSLIAGNIVVGAIQDGVSAVAYGALSQGHDANDYFDSGEGQSPLDSTPASLPDCPSGWSPVSRFTWSSGSTLVCSRSGDEYTVFLLSDGQLSRSDSARPTPTGVSAQFATDTLEVAFAGWLIWLNGKPATATQGWTSNQGDLNYTGTVGAILPCPTGNYALSVSTWQGGWLLICGAFDGSQENFHYVDGTRSGAGGDMYVDGSNYCGGDANGEQVCVSSAPALVQFIEPGKATVQRSATFNYFAESGAGGAGQGTGAYGVDAPGDTAEDQVGYLVAILEKSAAARSTVRAGLAPLNACTVEQADVDSLRNLTQARTDLLAALQTTPVDQVPDGARLLGLLTNALQLSEDADNGYVNTALQMLSGDCAGGRSSYHAALAVADQAEAAKGAFVEAWNASIPGQFGVRTFTAADI